MNNVCYIFIFIFLKLASVAHAESIIIPFDPNYEPLSFKTKEGQAAGFDVAVARKLAELADIEVKFRGVDFFEIQSTPWPKEWGFAVASMSRTPKRDKAFNFIGPYLFDTVVVVAAKSAPIVPVNNLKNIAIGVCTGCVYKSFLEGSYFSDQEGGPPIPGAKVKLFATDPDILRALSDPASGIQYGVTSAFHADYHISIGTSVKKLKPPLYLEPLWIVVPKSRSDLLVKLEAAFDKIAADGTLSVLSKKHLLFDYTQNTLE